MSVELSIVMPCLNEKRTVLSCIKKAQEALNRLGISGEIIVVDNGSKDNSPKIAQEAGARVILHDVKGYGSAIKRGIHESKGKYVIMGDADDTYDFSNIGEFIRLLREGADLVMGSRFKGTIHPKAMPLLHRFFGTPFLTWVLNIFFHANISDANCGLRGLKKESIERLNLKCNGMEFASEMIVKAAQKKLIIKETPIDYHPALSGRASHLSSFRDGWRHLRFMLMFCPKYLFLFPGLIIFLIGLVMVVVIFHKTIVVFNMPLGLSTAIFAHAMLFMGMQITLFGIYAMILNSAKGLTENDRITDYVRKTFTLERGLTFGGVILVAGLAMSLITLRFLFELSSSLQNVNIPLTKLSILSIFLVLLGIQIIFSFFYLGFLNLTETLK